MGSAEYYLVECVTKKNLCIAQIRRRPLVMFRHPCWCSDDLFSKLSICILPAEFSVQSFTAYHAFTSLYRNVYAEDRQSASIQCLTQLRVATLSVNLKRKSKVVAARPYECPSPTSRCWLYTCPSEGVLNLVATGSETAGLIRRRRRRAPIGCGLCSCQSVRTLPPPASDQSVILHGIDRRCGDEEAGRPAALWMRRRAAADRFYYCRRTDAPAHKDASPLRIALLAAVQRFCTSLHITQTYTIQ